MIFSPTADSGAHRDFSLLTKKRANHPLWRTGTMHIAVIGAGVAGLSCAQELSRAEHQVVVFDKGRSLGGRLATRRIGSHSFDLGAQYFTVRDQRFAAVVERAQQAGACSPWLGAIGALEEEQARIRSVEPVDRYVGTPGMNAFAKFMGHGLDVRSGCRVDRIEPVDKQLSLTGRAAPAGTTLGPSSNQTGAPGEVAAEFGTFDFVLVCLPPLQAASLIGHLSPALTAVTAQTEVWPCFAVGVVPSLADNTQSCPWDGLFVGRDEGRRSAIAWLARDSSKPGRPPGERWMLHASPAWSKASLALALEQVQATLLQEFARLLGNTAFEPEQVFTHRWAFAQVPRPQNQGAVLDTSAKLGLAGDWLAGGRVEGAYLSGLTLAEQLMAQP